MVIHPSLHDLLYITSRLVDKINNKKKMLIYIYSVYSVWTKCKGVFAETKNYVFNSKAHQQLLVVVDCCELYLEKYGGVQKHFTYCSCCFKVIFATHYWISAFRQRMFCYSVARQTSLCVFTNTEARYKLNLHSNILVMVYQLFNHLLKRIFKCPLSFQSFSLLVFPCSLCFHPSASHSSISVGDKYPLRRYWNKWPPALLSTDSTQLNLMLDCPCVFFLRLANKLIYSNFLMSPFASASSNISSTLLWGCAWLGWHPLINHLIRAN